MTGSACNAAAEEACPANAATSACTRVLFLGNSYTFVNDLPTTFARLALSGGHHVQVAMVANGGETLQQHNSAAESVDRINSQHWDYVVLQEQSEMPAFAASRDSLTYPAARALAARAKSAGAVPVFFMTWGHKDGMPASGLPDYTAMQQALDSAYSNIAKQLSAPVAPVGFTWSIVRHDHPDIDLWQSDGSHPTGAGTYLAACVFYASLFHESPQGLAYHGDVSGAQAAQLQDEAKTNVLDHEAWWGLK